MIRMLVDLPAPLGPRKPVTLPGWATNETSSTAVNAAVPFRHVFEGDHPGPLMPEGATGLIGTGARRACGLRRRTSCRASRARPSPSYSLTASASTCSGSCHGGMWVSSSRRDPASAAVRPASAPVRCRSGGFGRALEERGLAEEQVGVTGRVLEPRADAAVARVGERAAADLDAQGVRRDRVHHLAGGHPERPELHGAVVVGDEVELLVHPRVLVEVVGLGHPPGRVGRAPDRDLRAARRPGGTCASRSSRTGRGSGRRAGGRGRRRRCARASAYRCSEPSAPLPRSSSTRQVRPSCSASSR